MNRINQRTTWSLLLAIALVLFATMLIMGPLPALAQDGQSRQWVEVYVGSQSAVFVPAECVSGIEFQTGLTQDEADQTELSGFQQATITCDTSIYDAAGGNVIEDNSLIAGSTWFVNPVIWNLDEVVDQVGQPEAPVDTQTQIQPSLISQRAWIELQLTSAGPLVYVPSSCVQGLPSFGSIVWQGSRSESITFARENQTDQQLTQAQQQIDEFTGQPGQQQVDQFDWGHNFMVTLGCTTPIYNTPGGTAIEEIQLVAGQTWFAAPYLWFAPASTVPPVVEQPSIQSMEQQDQMTDEQDQTESQPTPQPTPQY